VLIRGRKEHFSVSEERSQAFMNFPALMRGPGAKGSRRSWPSGPVGGAEGAAGAEGGQ